MKRLVTGGAVLAAVLLLAAPSEAGAWGTCADAIPYLASTIALGNAQTQAGPNGISIANRPTGVVKSSGIALVQNPKRGGAVLTFGKASGNRKVYLAACEFSFKAGHWEVSESTYRTWQSSTQPTTWTSTFASAPGDERSVAYAAMAIISEPTPGDTETTVNVSIATR